MPISLRSFVEAPPLLGVMSVESDATGGPTHFSMQGEQR